MAPLGIIIGSFWGQSDTVVTQSPPTSEVGGSNPGPYAGNLIVAYEWLAVYRTLTNSTGMHWFLLPTKLPVVL